MSRKVKIILIFFALFVVWLVVAPLIAKNLIIEKPLEKADVILVLGGSSTYTERTRKASQIYKKGVSNKVLLTDDGGYAGWSQKEQRNPPFVDLAKQELIAQGVPAENIEIFKPEGSGTIYEARFVARKQIERNWDSIMLVTSPYHTRRVLWTFEEKISTGKLEFGITSPATGEQTPSPFIWWLMPKGWKMVAGEYVKSVVYWLYY